MPNHDRIAYREEGSAGAGFLEEVRP